MTATPSNKQVSISWKKFQQVICNVTAGYGEGAALERATGLSHSAIIRARSGGALRTENFLILCRHLNLNPYDFLQESQ